MEPTADIALIGLAVMGQNLILNMNDHGYTVVAFNRTVSKVDDFLNDAAKGRQDWAGAAAAMKEAVAAKPNNADYHNLYAYSLRKGGTKDMDLVFREYNEALRLDPKHRGAHEYLGEAYLQVGNLAKAKEELAALDKLCFFSCDEYTMLKKAVADYETKQAAR